MKPVLKTFVGMMLMLACIYLCMFIVGFGSVIGVGLLSAEQQDALFHAPFFGRFLSPDIDASIGGMIVVGTVVGYVLAIVLVKKFLFPNGSIKGAILGLVVSFFLFVFITILLSLVFGPISLPLFGRFLMGVLGIILGMQFPAWYRRR